MRDEEDVSSTITPGVTPTSVISSGSMTRARARQINGQVLSSLRMHDLTNKNMILHSCCDLLVLRNKGIDYCTVKPTWLVACMASTKPKVPYMHATCKKKKTQVLHNLV